MSVRKKTSTNSLNRNRLSSNCGMMYAMSILSGRWKLFILYKLEKQSLRFTEIKQLIPEITDRMLTLHLKEMESDRLVVRTVHSAIPPKVEYALSESARALAPIWKQLNKWGEMQRGLAERQYA